MGMKSNDRCNIAKSAFGNYVESYVEDEEEFV
jgi:hypothetical protein